MLARPGFGFAGLAATVRARCALDGSCTHYAGIRGGWVMACTMEPINKNPVTGSYALYASGDKSSLTCASSQTMTGDSPSSGPPSLLDRFVLWKESSMMITPS